MPTGKTIALTRWTFVDKVMSLLFNMLSRLVITFLPRSKRLLISWLQSPSAVILEPQKIKKKPYNLFSFSSVQSLCCVWLYMNPWTAACQASPSITNSQSLLKLMSIELVMPSNHLICSPLLLPPSIFPSIRVWEMSQFFASGGQRIGASASVLPMNIQDWFPLGLTSLISLHSKGISRVFSSNTVQLSL